MKRKKVSGKVKRVAKIRISNKLDNVEGSIENAPFFRRKMEKAEKFLVVAGLRKREDA